MNPQWTGDEMVTALDAYLNGDGVKAAAEAVGRTKDATANVIRSDVPNNYRKCLARLAPLRPRREEREWTTVEVKYLMKLIRKGRDRYEQCLILGRTQRQVEDKLREVSPTQTAKGFGLKGGG